MEDNIDILGVKQLALGVAEERVEQVYSEKGYRHAGLEFYLHCKYNDKAPNK